MSSTNGNPNKTLFGLEDLCSPILRRQNTPNPLHAQAARSANRPLAEEVPNTASQGAWDDDIRLGSAILDADDPSDHWSTHLSDEMDEDYSLAAYLSQGYQYGLASTFSTPRDRSPSRAGPSRAGLSSSSRAGPSSLSARIPLHSSNNNSSHNTSSAVVEETASKPKKKRQDIATGKGKGKQKAEESPSSSSSSSHSPSPLASRAPSPPPQNNLLTNPTRRLSSIDLGTHSQVSTSMFSRPAAASTAFLSPTSNLPPRTYTRSTPNLAPNRLSPSSPISREPSRSRQGPSSVEFLRPPGVEPRAYTNRDESGWFPQSRPDEDRSHFSEDTNAPESGLENPESKGLLKTMVGLRREIGSVLKRRGVMIPIFSRNQSRRALTRSRTSPILQVPIPQATVLQAPVPQVTVPQATVSQATVSQATVPQVLQEMAPPPPSVPTPQPAISEQPTVTHQPHTPLAHAAGMAVGTLHCHISPEGCHRYLPIVDGEPQLVCDYCEATITLIHMRRLLEIGVDVIHTLGLLVAALPRSS
ncbi:hypothetical protein BKA70DRAFT_1431189 [Coprinopsis sp. MPI-PUGE-AT-0042]|nr:hypothetical protein BKA70DRAFT_1431189 [Coprinopsis sp. MPI-PUGE-AT-0042]